MLFVVTLLAAAAVATAFVQPQPRSNGTRPNIIFILTDDQDSMMDSVSYMNGVKTHLIDQGTTFDHHFCTVSLCCPSRASLWTGKAAHNTNVTDLAPPYGGYPKFISQGFNDNWLPVWMQQGGYKTYYVGKLMNNHNITNYDTPYAGGFDGSDFLLEPGTYQYLNSTFQRDHDDPIIYPNVYSTDLLANKSFGFLDDAVQSGQPFFLTMAPIGPHCNIGNPLPGGATNSTPPIPAARHQDLFLDATVPRTPNFNPANASGASWVRNLPLQSDANVAFNDNYYVKRLQTLQSIDDIVNETISRLENYGILNNTYIIFSSDNGYHISQHRLQPGKQLPYEEDVRVPLIIRGPGVPAGVSRQFVTSHTDLAPTIMQMAGIVPSTGLELDGQAIPLAGVPDTSVPWEHVNIEHWGTAASDGDGYGNVFHPNNTYKAVRVVSASYTFFYDVWCNNDHELYDMQADPYQMNNLHGTNGTALGTTIDQIEARLDALLLVLKTCKTNSCTDPWKVLHPQGNVNCLADALNPEYNDFYQEQQPKVSYSQCDAGQILADEGPLDAVAFHVDPSWADWT